MIAAFIIGNALSLVAIYLTARWAANAPEEQLTPRRVDPYLNLTNRHYQRWE